MTETSSPNLGTSETETPTETESPIAVPKWEDLGLAPEILELVRKVGYQSPTPVQAEAIPYAVEGFDVLASAATGSGKTAVFVLPVVHRYRGKSGTLILALSPTREIAQQTAAVFETFGAPFGLKATVLIGGANMRLEEAARLSRLQERQ